MRETIRYYNNISKGYDELYGGEQMEKFAPLKLRGGRVLDVGCGTSLLTRALEAETVMGIDASAGMINQGRCANVLYVVGRAEALPFRDSVFGLVISTTVLQDVAEPENALSEMSRTGETTIFSVPLNSKLRVSEVAEAAGVGISGRFRAGKDDFYII